MNIIYRDIRVFIMAKELKTGKCPHAVTFLSQV